MIWLIGTAIIFIIAYFNEEQFEELVILLIIWTVVSTFFECLSEGDSNEC